MNRRNTIHLVAICLVLALAVFGGGWLSPDGATPLAPVAAAHAAPIDPALTAAFAASTDGQARFVVLFKEQAGWWGWLAP